VGIGGPYCAIKLVPNKIQQKKAIRFEGFTAPKAVDRIMIWAYNLLVKKTKGGRKHGQFKEKIKSAQGFHSVLTEKLSISRRMVLLFFKFAHFQDYITH
jgi:hypothetical protein